MRPVRSASTPDRHFQRVEGEVGVQAGGGLPPQDPTRVDVGDERDVHPPGVRLHVGDVRHPQDVRRERSEMPIHPVHRTLILGCGPGSVRALCPPDAADTHGSHEALHRAAGDMTCPMVCASLGPVEHDVHLPSAEGLIVLLINPADLPLQHVITLRSGRWGTLLARPIRRRGDLDTG